MFGIKSENGYHEILKGIKIKTINVGEKMLMTEFILEKGALLPQHSHPFEQTGYLVSGSIELFIGTSSHILKPGDSWNIPEDEQHNASILEDSIAIEIFTPARKDYLQFISNADIIE